MPASPVAVVAHHARPGVPVPYPASDGYRAAGWQYRSAVHSGVMVVPVGVVLLAMVGALMAGVVAGALLMDACTRPPRSMRPAPKVGRHRSTR